MKNAIACAAGLLACGTAHAQDVKVTPSAEVRLRYEHADQAGLLRDADAVTLRVRPGITAALGHWSALVEGEAVVALTRSYNDGTNGKTAYPLVADPENLELNRAQLRYAGHATAFTAGRQRIALADERFVGTAPWRQSEQTFDAARVQLGTPQGLSTDVTYSWNVRTVNGSNGTGARPGDIGGDNLFALLNYGTQIGTLTCFAYRIDQDQAAVPGFRLSNQPYGIRFAGSAPIAQDMKLGYPASWARQSDWHSNPNDYAATYWLGEASLTARALTATAGYEVLGSDGGT